MITPRAAKGQPRSRAAGAHERVERGAFPLGRVDRSLDGFGPFDLKAGAFEVADDLARRIEHGGILRSAVAMLEVAAVVTDEQEHPARRHRAGSGAHDRPPFRRGNLEIEDEHEVEGLRLGRVVEQVGGDPLRPHAARPGQRTRLLEAYP